jgi:hypothetical protein
MTADGVETMSFDINAGDIRVATSDADKSMNRN